MNIHKIEARDLPDLWFQAINDLLDVGKRFTVDRGSFAGQTRLEYDYFMGYIKDPGHGSGTPEILPDIPAHLGIPNPVEYEYVYGGKGYERSYIEYVMTSTVMPGESYTYGQRLTEFEIGDSNLPIVYEEDSKKEIYIQDEEIWNDSKIIVYRDGLIGPALNQIELAIWVYKNKGHRNNQMVLQVAKPDDMLLQDPPCLRQIDTRIQDGKLSFVVYFRSWDLWAGLPANLAGIQALKEYMAAEIGVGDGDMIVESKGLHLYGYAEDIAKMRCMKETIIADGGSCAKDLKREKKNI